MHNSAAEIAEQDRYAAALVTVLRASSFGTSRISLLSYRVWIELHLRVPQSAVSRYGTMAAFLAARPGVFQLLQSPSASKCPHPSDPAQVLVALTDGGHAGSIAPTAAPAAPQLSLTTIPVAPVPQPLPPASNPALFAAHLTSLLMQLERAAEGGDPPPAKVARFEDAPWRS
jgi:hypothetical protein